MNEEELLEYLILNGRTYLEEVDSESYPESSLEILRKLLNRSYERELIDEVGQGRRNHDGKALAIMARTLLTQQDPLSSDVLPAAEALASKRGLVAKDSSLFKALLYSDEGSSLKNNGDLSNPFALTGTISCSPWYIEKTYTGSSELGDIRPYTYDTKRRGHDLGAIHLEVSNGLVNPRFTIKNPFGNPGNEGSWSDQITLNVPRISAKALSKLNFDKLQNPLFYEESFPLEDLDCNSLHEIVLDYTKKSLDDYGRAVEALNGYRINLGQDRNPDQDEETSREPSKKTPITAPPSKSKIEGAKIEDEEQESNGLSPKSSSLK